MKSKIIIYGKYIFFLALILVVVVIYGFAVWYLQKNNGQYQMEQGISESLENYSSFSTMDIKVLKKEINDAVETKLEGIDTKELSKENLKELLIAVKEELNYATYNIPEEEINKMANDIVNQILELKVGGMTESEKKLLAAYQLKVDELTVQLGELEEKIRKIPYSAEEVKKIAQQYDWTAAEITNIITQNTKDENKLIEALAKELDMSVEELNEAIAKNREYSDALYIKLAESLETDALELKTLIEEVNSGTGADISSIIEELGITEKKLYAEIANCKEMSSNEREALSSALRMDMEDMHKLISENQTKTDNKIDNLESELKSNLSELEKASATKEALEKAQNSIQNAISAEESAREEAIQQAIADINSAIKASGENASVELQEARMKLEEALSDGMEETNIALEEAKSVIAGDLNTLDSKIKELNNTITEVQTGLNRTNENISFIEKNIEDMNENQVKTDEKITDLENEIKNNLSGLEEVSATKEELEKTQSSIQDVKSSVLYYEYDTDSKTLKLFENEEK